MSLPTMETTQNLNNPQKTRPKFTVFMSCFGISLSKEMQASDSPKKKKKMRNLLSWSRFRLPKCKSRTKTALVDVSPTTTSYKVQIKKGKANVFKSKSNANNYRLASNHASHSLQHQNIPADCNPICQIKSQEQEEKLPNLQNGQEESAEADVSRQEIEPTRVDSSQLGSPETKLNTTQNNASTSRAKTTTLPFISPPYSSKHLKLSRVPTKKRKEEGVGSMKKYDPIVGMSIIVVTLFIMLICGRLCAILCTSAWFYFIPRFRTSLHESKSRSDQLNLDSNEYKKKVVLKGFLQRDHHSTM